MTEFHEQLQAAENGSPAVEEPKPKARRGRKPKAKPEQQATPVVALVRPRIPPREPVGLADWKITVRHTPLKSKSLTVRADGKDDAWRKYLEESQRQATEANYPADPGRLAEVRAWLETARRQPLPQEVEVIGAEYAQARMDALRVKGTVTVEQIGFPELASVGAR